MRSDYLQGWIVDVQLNSEGNCMDVWLFDISQKMHRVSIPWCASIHVHAEDIRLDKLEEWLSLPEIVSRFSIGNIRMTKKRLSLDQFEMHNVMEIDVRDNRNIRRLAQHIEARGNHHIFSLYSVDAHLAQRFFVEFQVAPFDFVEWSGESFSVLKKNQPYPNLKVIELVFDYDSKNGFDTVESWMKGVDIYTWKGFVQSKKMFSRIIRTRSTNDFLTEFVNVIDHLNPDIIVTKGGDALHFEALDKIAKAADFDLNMGRMKRDLQPRTMSRVVHSYGQVIRKDSYFPLHGRLHIDLNASFIVREGGILGLFELAKHSRQSPQDISRLSPGSVISAIQMRIAMEDQVLVPWKKNRAEDTKTAWELLMADRGGLYLDSKPGFYQDVIELDFASLFPSIIATRNISPETLNCTCCQATIDNPDTESFIPLNPEMAEKTFRERDRKNLFSSKLFPSRTWSAIMVPGLKTHTCVLTHGFLGRVVSPLIERRMELKRMRKTKGDLYDLQQNALKWLLVTCFGYTGYKNARFGRIEAHEAICAWAREILLDTISIAEDEGWEVLHAIVDCVWIENKKLESREEKIEGALQLAKRVTDKIGIPLEFEDIYDFIGFLPSRMHSAGSLTKYWAHGMNGFKLRGIESRQHSTCKWIKEIQNSALEILKRDISNGRDFSRANTESKIVEMLHSELKRLYSNKIRYSDLIITKRVTKQINEFSVSTRTRVALIRAKHLGQNILPGRKVRYVATKKITKNPMSGVILSQELNCGKNVDLDCKHYENLAIRAIWSILGPFGWTDEDISKGSKKYTLFDFFESLNTKPAIDDSVY